MRPVFFFLFAASMQFALVSCESTSSTATTAGASSGSQSGQSSVKPYPLSTCLVTGEPLNSKGTPKTRIYKGQEVKVCCAACQMAFKSNPEAYLTKIQ